MKRLLSGKQGVAAVLLALLALAVRLHNAFHYPADWGYDASFNWRYIYRMAHDWALPRPGAGWSTADPPLFFTASAILMAASNFTLVLVPLFNTALGLGIVALAVILVRDAEPERPRRSLLAAGLLLFLPAHIYMSVMVNEEMLGAFFASLVVLALARRDRAGVEARSELWRAAGVGAAAGLALLTKLSGAVVIVAAAGTYALDGWRRADWRSALARAAAVVLVAAVVGGWYFARNRALYGYFQPFGLPAHEVMFEMPPGERGPIDYIWIPLATWTDPQLLDPDLLHSLWGSTYATVWFDGHRYFLPRDSQAVRRLGTATLLLALLPTAAFAIGLAGGLRRWLRAPRAADAPLLLLTALTLLGFAVYNWQNPWYAVVKGTTLLGLSLPFAYYASEVLDRWTRRGGAIAALVWTVLAALTVTVVLSCTFNLAFEKTEVSGLQWRVPEEP
jgi:4-amino-4-deoxy-L-arabinose transferase-like glycosyltransferase